MSYTVTGEVSFTFTTLEEYLGARTQALGQAGVTILQEDEPLRTLHLDINVQG